MHGTFEHKADIGIYGEGKNFSETLEELSRALFSIMYSEKGKKKKKKEINVCEKDKNLLVLNFLNELISIAQDILFADIEVKAEKNCISAIVYFEDFNPKKIVTEVKGATLSGMKIDEKRIQAIVDV